MLANNFPSCVLGVFQITVFILSVSGLLACLEQCSALWILSQPSLLPFKTPNFRGLVWWEPALVFGRAVMPQHRGVGFGAK